jgi:radical SAM-linked protein
VPCRGTSRPVCPAAKFAKVAEARARNQQVKNLARSGTNVVSKESNQPATRYRFAVDFTVDGDIRFVAHNDMLRMFSRACARAALPVSFTAGFNPRIRLSLPFPRPVGQSSDAERLILDLTELLDPAEVLARLVRQMPAGVELRGAQRLSSSDSCPPERVRYHVALRPSDGDAFQERIRTLLASATVEITRVRHKDGKSKVVNIRPFVDALTATPEGVDMTLSTNDSGSATPEDVCRALGMEADAINPLVRRVEIRWHVKAPTPPPP